MDEVIKKAFQSARLGVVIHKTQARTNSAFQGELLDLFLIFWTTRTAHVANDNEVVFGGEEYPRFPNAVNLLKDHMQVEMQIVSDNDDMKASSSSIQHSAPLRLCDQKISEHVIEKYRLTHTEDRTGTPTTSNGSVFSAQMRVDVSGDFVGKQLILSISVLVSTLALANYKGYAQVFDTESSPDHTAALDALYNLSRSVPLGIPPRRLQCPLRVERALRINTRYFDVEDTACLSITIENALKEHPLVVQAVRFSMSNVLTSRKPFSLQARENLVKNSFLKEVPHLEEKPISLLPGEKYSFVARIVPPEIDDARISRAGAFSMQNTSSATSPRHDVRTSVLVVQWSNPLTEYPAVHREIVTWKQAVANPIGLAITVSGESPVKIGEVTTLCVTLQNNTRTSVDAVVRFLATPTVPMKGNISASEITGQIGGGPCLHVIDSPSYVIVDSMTTLGMLKPGQAATVNVDFIPMKSGLSSIQDLYILDRMNGEAHAMTRPYSFFAVN